MFNSVINNQYKILKKINECGMFNVFLAQDIINNKDIVVKSLKDQILSNKIHDIVRFQNETSLISRLNHSNIVFDLFGRSLPVDKTSSDFYN